MSLKDRYNQAFGFDIKPKPICNMKDNIMPHYKSTSNTDDNKSPFEFSFDIDFRHLYPVKFSPRGIVVEVSKRVKLQHNCFNFIPAFGSRYFERGSIRDQFTVSTKRNGDNFIVEKIIVRKNKFKDNYYLKNVSTKDIFYIPDNEMYKLSESPFNNKGYTVSYYELSSRNKFKVDDLDLRIGCEIRFGKKSGGIFYEDI